MIESINLQVASCVEINMYIHDIANNFCLIDLSHQYKKNKVYDVNIDDKFTKKHVASDSNGIASSFDEMFGYHDDCGNYNEVRYGNRIRGLCVMMVVSLLSTSFLFFPHSACYVLHYFALSIYFNKN